MADVAAVPEPTSVLLLLIGLLAVARLPASHETVSSD